MSFRRLRDGRWAVDYRDGDGRPRRQYFGRGPMAGWLAKGAKLSKGASLD